MRVRSLHKILAAHLAASLGLAVALLSSGPVQAETSRKAVVATIAQIGQPLKVIAGGKARVETLMGEGVDPHLYRLTRSDVRKLVHADLILYNGLDLEAQMVDMMARFARHKPVVAVAESLVGSGLSKSGHAYDPHVWMDPVLWTSALESAVQALKKLDPDNADVYRRNASDYFRKMMETDARARNAIASIPPERRTLVTAHDAFGYFGRAYGLDVLAIQGLSTESEAGVRRIEALVNVLIDRQITAVFVETSVSERSVRALIEGAAAGGQRVRIGGRLYSDALGPRGTSTGTWLGMFKHNVETIVRALGPPIRRDVAAMAPLAKNGRIR